MKKSFFLLTAILALFLQSCRPVQSVFLGIRDPKVKTEKQLLKYATRKGLQTDNNFSLRDSLTFEKYFYTITSGKSSMAVVYDREGKMLYRYDTTGCPGPYLQYLQSICTNKQETQADSLFTDRMNDLVPFSATTNKVINTGDYDYTIVLYWARFLGMMNKKHARNYEQILQQNHGCKIQYIKVSLDPRDFWKMRK
jgi:hypothetical protein